MLTSAIFHYVFSRLFLYQAIATLATTLAIRLAFVYWTRAKRFKLLREYGIPGPEPRLYDGNLGYILKKPYQAHLEFKKKYGKVYGVFIADYPELLISDLDMLKKIFLDKVSCFRDRTYMFIDMPLADSILFTRYEQWKFLRKVMSTEFSNYRVKGTGPSQFIEDSIELMLNHIDNKLNAAQGGAELSFDIHNLMKATALHMISSMAIKLPNVKVSENEDYVKFLDEFLAIADKGIALYAIKFPFLASIFSFLANNFEYDKTMALIRRGITRMVSSSLHRLSQGKSANTGKNGQACLIDLLIKLHHQEKLTLRGILGNAEAILFAGYDTTSTTLTYIFWILARYPEYQEKLRSDLKAHGTDSEYINQIIAETMRLYPTVTSFTTRMCTETVNINGLVIPQGTRVMYHAMLIHHDPKIWPDPLKFDPDRFKPGVEHHPCAFAPFGLGERKCLGYHLALLEMKMIICELLLRYRLRLKSPHTLELEVNGAVLTKPKEKVLLQLERLTG